MQEERGPSPSRAISTYEVFHDQNREMARLEEGLGLGSRLGSGLGLELGLGPALGLGSNVA